MKVGSLRWLEASASQRWSSIKLTDIWLLLLRCAIIVLLAVALAVPLWSGAPAAENSQKGIYIGEELLHAAALNTIKPTVDALLQSGYRLYAYKPGFTPIPQEQWQVLSNTSHDSINASGNHWSLISALAQRHKAPSDSAWLFTSDQQRHFAGARPASIPDNITWLPVRLEATATWLQTASAFSPDSLQLLLGHSRPEGTRYSRHRIILPTASQAVALQNGQQVQLMRAGDSLWARLAEQPERRVPVRTQPLQFAVYTDKEQQAEIRYLEAVGRALSQYTGIRISMTSETAPDTAAAMAFWLRDAAVPESLLRQVRERGMGLWLQPVAPAAQTIPASFTAAGTKLKVNTQRIPSAANEFPVWETENGEPLLTEELLGKGRIYRFRSGFGPARSELGQSPLLPELLLPLVLSVPPSSDADMRVLEEQQIRLPQQPVTAVARPATQQYPLARWFTAAAFVLFAMERLIVTRKRTSV